ncbi:caspase family protein [Sulfitobacter sp.]|uniref:caspase family protein n=1 Tax=Sulfitobacter sp. TaxID=1903071 RepID=UPI003EF8086C
MFFENLVPKQTLIGNDAKMKILCIRLLAICFIFLLTPIKVFAGGERIALVIGNAAYEGEAELRNTINDARLIADTLSEVGFDVEIIENLTKADGPSEIEDFGKKAKTSEIAIIYFAGHGMELAGENYLIPVDANVSSENVTIRESIALEVLQRAVSGASKAGLVLFDACRTNPWVSEKNQGLTGVKPVANNILISFAAQPGNVAYDGGGANGPYALALSSVLKEKLGYEVGVMFRVVSSQVEAATHGKQDPSTVVNLSPDPVYLSPEASNVNSQSIEQAFSSGGAAVSAGSSVEELLRVAPLRSTSDIDTIGLTECDRQAGYTWRPRVKGGVRKWDDIDAEAAYFACLQAIADHPNEPFFLILAARSLWKADDSDKRIFKYIKRGVQADEGFALERMANLAFLGRSGVEENRDAAFLLALLSANNGYPQALIEIGDLFRDNEPPDVERAMDLYNLAKEAGLIEASAKLAWAMMNDTSVKRNFTETRALYEAAAAADVAWAINNLGAMDKQGQGISEPDLARALLRYEEACSLDYYLGCRNAGDILTNPPYRTTQNFLRAEIFYIKACDNGNVLGCFGLGWLNDTNRLPNADIELAKSNYRLACAEDVSGACNNLAIILFGEGNGNETLIDTAALWKKACNLGDRIACGNIGARLRDHGSIIRPNAATDEINHEAFSAFEKGCGLQDAYSCNSLGNAFWNVEIGLEQDYEKAASYYLLACDGGNDWGCNNRARLALYGYIKIADDPLEILQDLCERDHAPGCRYWGEFTESDAFLDSTALRDAHAAIEKACALGDAKSCRHLAFEYFGFDPEWNAFPHGEYLARFLQSSDNLETFARDLDAFHEGESRRMRLDEFLSALSGVEPFAQEFQRALKERGLYDGAIDGILGPQTRIAAEQLVGQSMIRN